MATATIDQAFDLIVRFQRCPNYPRDSKGVHALAKGLMRAAEIVGISMAEIVERCSEESEFCPSDFAMLSTARGLAPQRSQAETQSSRNCPFGKCDGSGWKEAYVLHTRHTDPTYVEKQRITAEQYEDLSKKVDWVKQMVFAGRSRCECHPARPEEIERKGKYA